MESDLAIKERHRVELLVAEKPPIGAFVMILLITIGGTVLSFVMSFSFFIWYILIGCVIFSFNSFVVKRRFNGLVEKHHAEWESRRKPLKVEAIE